MSFIVSKFGGEFIAASRDFIVKEGISNGNFTAIIRFPSYEAANAMYKSVEYEPLKTKRIKKLTNYEKCHFCSCYLKNLII